MMNVLTDLRLYLTRPIIPFCFGIPLLLPATLLTVVAFLQNYISTTLHVLGFLFLSMAVLSIGCGMVLGFRDVCRNKTVKKRPTTKGFQRVHRKVPKFVSGNSISPESPSMPNSQSSSRSSTCSAGSLMITNEMIRLVPHMARKNKSRKGRFQVRTNILPRKTRLMPAVQEEDQTQAPENVDMGRNNLRSTKTEKNLQKLEKHLREMGLGEVNRRMAKSPVDVETVPATDRGYKTREATPARRNKGKGHSRTRSLPEKEITKVMSAPRDTVDPIVSGSAREEDLLRRSARAARRQQEANQQQQQQQKHQPVLTSESHERMGIRISMGNTIL